MSQFTKSFRFSWAGIGKAIVTERNLRIHMVIGAYVIFFGVVGQLADWQWVVCLVCIGLVLASELHNTALERLCDKFTSDNNAVICFSKDVAAGGVFVSALSAAAAGLIVFLNPDVLAVVWKNLRDHPVWVAGGFVALLAAGLYFIRGKKQKK